MVNPSFVQFSSSDVGLLFDDSKHSKYPIRYHHVIDGDGAPTNKESSYFGFVYQGSANVTNIGGISATLPKDTFFSCHEIPQLTGIFRAILIEVITVAGEYSANNYKAQALIGGKVEAVGRLRYIDGCTDSLLIPPVKKGDPCLNHLHFPCGIIQTPHTHPSHRIGVVIRGEGECVTPFGDMPLKTGCIFLIKEDDGTKHQGKDGLLHEAGTHKFNTHGSSMDVIAFHPDSDFGPEDDSHPMINRTMVDGISAKYIQRIKTKGG